MEQVPRCCTLLASSVENSSVERAVEPPTANSSVQFGCQHREYGRQAAFERCSCATAQYSRAPAFPGPPLPPRSKIILIARGPRPSPPRHSVRPRLKQENAPVVGPFLDPLFCPLLDNPSLYVISYKFLRLRSLHRSLAPRTSTTAKTAKCTPYQGSTFR